MNYRDQDNVEVARTMGVLILILLSGLCVPILVRVIS